MRHDNPKRTFGDLNDPQGLGMMLEKFLEWLEIRNYSPRTITQRRPLIGQFIEWAELRGLLRPSQITKAILERYQRHLYHYRKADGTPLTMRSQYNRLLPLRAWFKWLAKHNHILFNPASELELPKLEHRLPKHILNVSEVEAVIEQPRVDDSLGIRDRAILETLYSTGLRRMELIGLQLGDVDAAGGVATVRQGKGKRDRVVPIGRRAMAWIERYVREVRPVLVGDRDPGALFVSREGNPLSPRRLTRLTYDYVRSANLRKTGSCHLFRHTMATLMHENGADIRHIQALLGHASISTTQIYTRVSIRKLKEIHDKTHPGKMKRKRGGERDDNDEGPPTNRHSPTG